MARPKWCIEHERWLAECIEEHPEEESSDDNNAA